jgi:uncharacterized membrane protein
LTTLTAFKFDSPDGAERMAGLLKELQRQQLITIHDAAVVSWPQGAKKPKTSQLHNMTATGALDGAFWGMLFGLLFFVPLLGMAVGAGMGALAGSFSDVGIDDKFIKQVQSQVTQGTSALFLLTSDAVMDKVMGEIKSHDLHPVLISSNLSTDQENELRSAFSTEASGAADSTEASSAAAAN